MIKEIKDITEYFEWIDEFVCDKHFSTPFYDKERIKSVAKKDSSILLTSFEGQRLTGMFCLMILNEEKYIETLFLYTREKEAYDELLDFLSKQYAGYEIWFVYNPMNHVLNSYLSEKQAFFYEEQRYMEYKSGETTDVPEIIPYSDLYRDEYISIHSEEGYWDGEKVLESMDEFYVFLCIRDEKLVGYIDLGKGNNANEIMDIWILPEYRNRGIGALLLKKAIFINKDDQLVLTVDVDNDSANHLYEKMGFVEIAANNCVTAKMVI